MEDLVRAMGRTHISINTFTSKKIVQLTEAIFDFAGVTTKDPNDFKANYKDLYEHAVLLTEKDETWFKENYPVIKVVF